MAFDSVTFDSGGMAGTILVVTSDVPCALGRIVVIMVYDDIGV